METTKKQMIPDSEKPAEQLPAERTKRLEDVHALRQPDRVPIQLDFTDPCINS